MQQTFSDVWSQLCIAVKSSDRRLVDELTAAWEGINALIARQKGHWELALLWHRPAGQISSLRALFEDGGRQLLSEPLDSFWSARVHEKVTDALYRYQTELDRLISNLPSSIHVSRRDLLQTLALRGNVTTWRRLSISMTVWSKEVQLHRMVKGCLELEAADLLKHVAPLLMLAAQTSIEITVPWQVLLGEELRRLSGLRSDSRPVRQGARLWLRRIADNSDRAALLLKRMGDWADGSSSRLDMRLLRALKSSSANGDQPDLEFGEFRATWSRYHGAVAARLKLDSEVCQVVRNIARRCMEAVKDVEQEQRELQQELEETIGWLDKAEHEEDLPSRRGAVSTAGRRTADFKEVVIGVVRVGCPLDIQLFLGPTRLFRSRPLLRDVRAQALLMESMERLWEAVSEGFLKTEMANRTILADIERARQVVEFGREAATREGQRGREVAHEAVGNARRLLDHRRRVTEGTHTFLEQKLANAVSSSLLDFHMALCHLRGGGEIIEQFGLRKAAGLYWLMLRWSVTKRVGRIRLFLAAGYDAVQSGLHGKPDKVKRVTTRFTIGPANAIPVGPPPFYARLFQPGAVEDLRFLVGRDAEMAALGELRECWKSSRPAAALVVGERGSGKTSLLNCATSRLFRDIDPVRAEIQKRIRTTGEMRQFVSGLFGFSVADDFETSLLGVQRVVMIEGLEWTFLRQVGGYEALRELLRIIAMTSGRILWVLTTNDVSFHFLDAAFRIRQYFTQSLYTMPVERNDIEEAILMRHHLTGWRLHVTDSVIAQRKDPSYAHSKSDTGDEWAGFPFGQLFRDSDGIFAAAFYLWLHSIERAEDGVLYVKYRGQDATEHGLPALNLGYMQTLFALLLHGGITVEEDAAVCGTPVHESRMRLEALSESGLVERDAISGHFHVQTSAIGPVRRALRRTNLLPPPARTGVTDSIK